MADLSTLRRSPLAHLADAAAGAVRGDRGVTLRELPFRTMLSLRVGPGSEAERRLSRVLGAELPRRCGQTARAGRHTLLWLGPDEWLVVSEEDAAALLPLLVEALGDGRGDVVDVSANRTILELSGPSARQVLEKGCAVDLHPRSFGPGNAVSTAVGPVPVVLWQTDATTYRLLPRGSFADYLARWLLDAMVEFDGPEVP